MLRDSPGISVKQGNGPRDFGISIRGSNARNGFGIRNLVIFDDGFPVTQPDGLSRSDLIDPRAYGAIDVIRGPSSALYGNYATGGALNFRTRPGGTIDGVEYGVDGGSFGYLNNYLTAGKKVGNFEDSLFASDARGDGFIQQQLVQYPDGQFSRHAAGDARRSLHGQVHQQRSDTRLPIRSSLNQFYQNPFQQGCEPARRCARLRNGVAVQQRLQRRAGTDRETAVQAGLGRNDRRTIVGGRWEHDFDNTTTWRNQFVFDDRNISQPTGATSAIGDFPSYNYMSDVTKRGEIFGMDSTTYFGGFYNTLTASSDTRNVMPGGNATLGLLSSNTVQRHHQLWGSRARGTQADPDADGDCRDRMGNDPSEGHQYRLHLHRTVNVPTTTIGSPSADRQFQNTAPELALLYKLNNEWQFRGARRHRLRHAAGRQPVRAAERPVRQQYPAQDADKISATTSASTGRRTTRSS